MMDFLTDLEKLEGKTITSATFVDHDEAFALIFDDDTCAYLGVSLCGDSFDLYLSSDAEDHLMRDAGIISETQYLLKKAWLDKIRAEKREQGERAELAKLKKKYGDTSSGVCER